MRTRRHVLLAVLFVAGAVHASASYAQAQMYVATEVMPRGGGACVADEWGEDPRAAQGYEALEPLAQAVLTDSDSVEKDACLTALRRFGSAAVMRFASVTRRFELRNRDLHAVNRQLMALRWLKKLGDPRATPAIIALLRRTRDRSRNDEISLAAIDLLARNPTPAVLDVLDETVRKATPAVVDRAAKTLAGLDDPCALALSAALLKRWTLRRETRWTIALNLQASRNRATADVGRRLAPWNITDLASSFEPGSPFWFMNPESWVRLFVLALLVITPFGGWPLALYAAAVLEARWPGAWASSMAMMLVGALPFVVGFVFGSQDHLTIASVLVFVICCPTLLLVGAVARMGLRVLTKGRIAWARPPMLIEGAGMYGGYLLGIFWVLAFL